MEQNRVITFNCGGKEFAISEQTLLLYSDGFLYKMLCNKGMKPGQLIKAKNGEMIYFIDRDPSVTKAILNYYRDGILDKPADISDEIWKLNLNFFGVDFKQENSTNISTKTIFDLIGKEWREIINYPYYAYEKLVDPIFAVGSINFKITSPDTAILEFNRDSCYTDIIHLYSATNCANYANYTNIFSIKTNEWIFCGSYKKCLFRVNLRVRELYMRYGYDTMIAITTRSDKEFYTLTVPLIHVISQN